MRKFFQDEQYDTVLFTGCGSTYYLGLAAAALFQEQTGIPARGLPASEVWLYPQSAVPKGRCLLVAVSRSGETTETVLACEHFKAARCGDILTVSCYPGRILTTMGKLNLVLPSGQEQSIAQTRAFSTLYLATVAMAGLAAGKTDWLEALGQLPATGRRLLELHDSLAGEVGRNLQLDRFYFLGSGARYGLACELSLKMKEMTLSHSEPFHFLEFRHGPKSMAAASALMVALVSQQNAAQEMAVVKDMQALGANVLTLGEKDAMICFNSGLAEALRNVLYLPVIQKMAFERSLAKGLNPDLPNNLDAVVKLG
jgi:glucosamine--fructose-6-phosphate aminotransferase (isomerizing)